jgi:hypothetical protein
MNKAEEYPLYESADEIIDALCPDITERERPFIRKGIEQYAQQRERGTAEAAWVAAKMNVAAFMPRGDDYKALTFDEWYTNHQNQE